MKKKLIIITIILILIIAGALVFYILSAPPQDQLSKEFKEDAVTKLLGRKAQLDPDSAPTGDTDFGGKYITFSYPARAIIYSYRDNASKSATLEDFSFDIKEPKLVFNMRVTLNDSNLGTIDDLPAVKLRESRSYEYKKAKIAIGNTPGVSFFKTDNGGEKSGFVLYKGMIFTFSVTSPSPEEAEKLFDKVISSAKMK